MTREQAIKSLKWFKEYNEEDYCGGDRIKDKYGDWYYRINEDDFTAFDMAIQALQAQADGEYISRQDAIEFFKDDVYVVNELKNIATVAIPSAEPNDFAKWVASEIFDEWEYNKDSFAEIACRKLARLGIVRAKGDEWELVEPQERSEE
jgi:hypothetical protein